MRPGCPTSSPGRWPTASRRSGSPTTATCTASSTSTRRPAQAGIKPIIGIEAYQAAESRFERPVRRGRIDDGGGDAEAGEKLYYHLTLLAENGAGYKNLLKLSSAAYLEGYFYKPRADWELLERYHEGVIATTGCLGGLVLQALLKGDTERAADAGRPAAGHLRAGQPVRGAAGPRPRRAAPDQPGADPPGPAHRRPAPGHQRQPLRLPPRRRGPRRPAVRADRLGQGRPEALQVPRRRALPEDRGRDARTCSGTTPRRATTPCGSPSGPTSRSSSANRSCRPFPGPDGFPTPTPTCATWPTRGRPSATASPSPPRSASASTTSSASSPTWGSRTTSWSCGT